MKKFKKLIPAMVMLLIATMLMGTTTYAWFSMNTTVTATGMTVQAKAEGGLLISSTHQDGTWSNTSAVTLGKTVKLLPASTADGSAWYHAHSTASNNAIAIADGYYQLTSSGSDSEPTGTAKANAGALVTASENLFDTTGGSAVIVYDENGSDSAYTVDTDDGFYLLTKYYIRSSGAAISVGSTGTYNALAINRVSVSTATNSALLDKSLRIGVAIYDESDTLASDFVILAPINGADGATANGSAKQQTTANVTDASALVGLCAPAVADPATAAITEYYANANTGFGKSALDQIPANTSSQYLTAYIYVWFEGEDSECYSDHITTSLDSLSIQVSFKITSTATEYNDIATAIS